MPEEKQSKLTPEAQVRHEACKYTFCTQTSLFCLKIKGIIHPNNDHVAPYLCSSAYLCPWRCETQNGKENPS